MYVFMWKRNNGTILILQHSSLVLESIILCLFQITAVCDFMTYIRYITQGLVKSDGKT